MFSEEIPYMIEKTDALSPAEKRDNWYVSFGLQAVDGLKPSKYLVGLAEDHIAGDKTYAQVAASVEEYYSGEKSGANAGNEGNAGNEKEADFVSLRIQELLSEKAFTFSPVALKGIHKRLFTGILDPDIPVGEYRKYNITKGERVLSGNSVLYSSANMIADTLYYDFENEKSYNYAGMTTAEIAYHAMDFVSGIWQIHPFAEGNTRTCAAFAIGYFSMLGFALDNEPFKKHSGYFRDALVMNNCGINKNPVYLRMFADNLLLGGSHDLNFDIPVIVIDN